MLPKQKKKNYPIVIVVLNVLDRTGGLRWSAGVVGIELSGVRDWIVEIAGEG